MCQHRSISELNQQTAAIHSCWYCAYRAKDLQLGDTMSEADSLPAAKMFEIVDDIIAMDVKAVTFSGGGEPLLYKPLPDIIAALGNADIKIGLLTNGANLQGRYADALCAHATWVRVSMDGWDDVSHSRARTTKLGDFDKIIANIRAFSEFAHACTLGVRFIIGRANHRHILDACRVLKDAGVRHVKLSAAVVSNDRTENNDYHSPLRCSVNDQIDQARELESEGFRIVDHYHAMDTRFEKPYNRRPAAKLLTIIGADQTVYACQDKAYTSTGRLGSIENISFKEFWYSDENRRRLDTLDPRVSCRHHCVSHAKNVAVSDYLSIDRKHMEFI